MKKLSRRAVSLCFIMAVVSGGAGCEAHSAQKPGSPGAAEADPGVPKNRTAEISSVEQLAAWQDAPTCKGCTPCDVSCTRLTEAELQQWKAREKAAGDTELSSSTGGGFAVPAGLKRCVTRNPDGKACTCCEVNIIKGR